MHKTEVLITKVKKLNIIIIFFKSTSKLTVWITLYLPRSLQKTLIIRIIVKTKAKMFELEQRNERQDNRFIKS